MKNQKLKFDPWTLEEETPPKEWGEIGVSVGLWPLNWELTFDHSSKFIFTQIGPVHIMVRLP